MNIKMFEVSNSFIKNKCYLIYKNETGILIDPAWEYKLIYDFIKSNNIVLKAVLLTHSHEDHVNLAEEFAVNFEAPVFMSLIEILNYNFKITNLNSVYHQEKIKIDLFEIIPIITPGHTLGSTCYLINGNLFSGDTIFIEGVGICNLKNVDLLYDSVQMLKTILPHDTIIWPGHSFGEPPGKTLDYLLRYNIYFQFNREQFIAYRTRKNQPNPFLFK